MPEDVSKEELGNFRSGYRRRGRNEVNMLGKAVHNHEDGVVVALGFRQVGDEVHRNLFPSIGWDWQGFSSPAAARLVDLLC